MSKPESPLPLADGNTVRERYNLTPVECFTDIEKKQKEFHEWLKARKLATAEARAITCKTSEESAKFWADMSQDAQSEFEGKHKKGWRLWVSKYQSFAKGAASFMEDLKPVLDIVQSAGVPYSGVAVGTVTALLTFSGRKNDMENQISSAIEGVKDRLPGFKMYQAIYADNTELEIDLRKKILFAYLAFIEMSMAIIKYYFQAGYRRWGTALFHSNKFKNMTDNVYNLLSDIRLRCEELLSLKVHTLVGDVGKLRGLNETMCSNRWCRTFLGLSSWTPEEHHQKLLRYIGWLHDDSSVEAIYEQMTPGKIETRRRDRVFIEWNVPTVSSLLIIRGVNNENIRQGKLLNWTSLFALDLVYRLHKDSSSHSPPYAVYIFDPSRTANPASCSLFTAMLIVLIQLLWQRREELGNSSHGHRESLMAALHKYHDISRVQDSGSSDEKFEALGALAEQVMHLYEKEEQPVYIVLDRVDKCSDHYELMSILVNNIMSKASCPVKILLVADYPTAWPALAFFRFDTKVQLREVTWMQELLYQGY
ncbi:hypothetical protein BT96DRAFT_942603 [Gymnopus androsaceus JB14]|uniref:Uncharacterized protein n=1 Tax=Gymnopus androsaceus JB14 TaxID=1447944 RepID=A0A6A4HA98_9AGAR|nr:hypothetical protein BT96DRAFT_942603 [Gymnopus androsaceus JB14]